MAKVIKRVWLGRGPSGHRVRRVAYGYTVQVGRKQIRKFDAAWDREGARQALAACLLGQAPPAPALPVVRGLTLGAAVHRYLQEKSRKRSWAEDRRITRMLCAAFGTATPLRALTAGRISAWKAERLAIETSRRGRPLSAAAINRPLACLRHLLTLAHREWEEIDAVSTITLEAEPEGRVLWLSPAGEATLLDACAACRVTDLFVLVFLAVETGMRKGELLGLEWARIDLSRGVIGLASRSTKSKRRREIPMRDGVYRLLAERAHEDEQYVFPRRAWSTYRAAWEAIAGARVTEPDGEPLTFHGLRHHFASWFMMRGGRLEALSKILGHASLAMTLRYAHLAPDYLRAEMERTDASLGAPFSTKSAHSDRIAPDLLAKSATRRGSSEAEQLIRKQTLAAVIPPTSAPPSDGAPP
jgi:integrase